MTIIWCMVSEIWSATDRTFSHSRPSFALLPPYGPRKQKFYKNEKGTWRYYNLTNVYHKWQSYDVWFLKTRVQRTEFFIILDHFLPFYPPNNPKNQNFQKIKKNPGDIILRRCNHKWQLYDVCTERDRQNFLSF